MKDEQKKNFIDSVKFMNLRKSIKILNNIHESYIRSKLRGYKQIEESFVKLYK